MSSLAKKSPPNKQTQYILVASNNYQQTCFKWKTVIKIDHFRFASLSPKAKHDILFNYYYDICTSASGEREARMKWLFWLLFWFETSLLVNYGEVNYGEEQ